MKSRLSRPESIASRRLVLDAIEWEELPSLVGRLHAATANATDPAAPAWEATMPASLDAELPTEPFREAVDGLSVREVLEPEVFRHFFGRDYPA